MMIGFKAKIYVPWDMGAKLVHWANGQRRVRNGKVAEFLDAYAAAIDSLQAGGEFRIEVDQAYSRIQKLEENRWLETVPSGVKRNGVFCGKASTDRWFGTRFDANAGLDGELSGQPRYASRKDGIRLWLTREFFIIRGERIYIGDGTKKGANDIGWFKWDRPFGFRGDPASIHLAMIREGTGEKDPSLWTISFSYDDGVTPLSEEELRDAFLALSPEEQERVTVGHDRGVVLTDADSDGFTRAWTPEQLEHMDQVERKIRHLQKKRARQVMGSRNSRKTARQIGKLQAHLANCRENHAHHVSADNIRKGVETGRKVQVFEKLNLKAMTKSPEPKPDGETGNFLPNGSAAKAGLNRAILQRGCMGRIRRYTEYKARRANMLVVDVDPRNTSRTCPQCGHVAAENRRTQADFVCVQCGHAANADLNAAIIIKARGLELLRSGGFRTANEIEAEKKAARKAARAVKDADSAEPADAANATVTEGTETPNPKGRKGGRRKACSGNGRNGQVNRRWKIFHTQGRLTPIR
ncbi:MAG: transposase [Desulfovibrio sp.]|jgi:putative transposase|nr:transposase [Desulfovibrio sp.]